jgi:hypothetical protein
MLLKFACASDVNAVCASVFISKNVFILYLEQNKHNLKGIFSTTYKSSFSQAQRPVS